MSRRRQDGEKVFANVEVQKLQEGVVAKITIFTVSLSHLMGHGHDFD